MSSNIITDDLLEMDTETEAFQSHNVIDSSAVVNDEFAMALFIAALLGKNVKFLIIDEGMCSSD